MAGVPGPPCKEGTKASSSTAMLSRCCTKPTASRSSGSRNCCCWTPHRWPDSHPRCSSKGAGGTTFARGTTALNRVREARARVRERGRAQTVFQLGLLNTEHSQLTLRLCDRYPRLPKLKLKPLFKDILSLQAVLAAQQALFRERREMVALWRALLNQKQTFKGGTL